MNKTYANGEVRFDDFGEGFVTLKMIPRTSIRALLLELGLLEFKGKGRYNIIYDWKQSVQDFFASHGYTRTADIINALKTNGVILKSSKAVEFRLRFL